MTGYLLNRPPPVGTVKSQERGVPGSAENGVQRKSICKSRMKVLIFLVPPPLTSQIMTKNRRERWSKEGTPGKGHFEQRYRGRTERGDETNSLETEDGLPEVVGDICMSEW